jgi:hypothetical protein
MFLFIWGSKDEKPYVRLSVQQKSKDITDAKYNRISVGGKPKNQSSEPSEAILRSKSKEYDALMKTRAKFNTKYDRLKNNLTKAQEAIRNNICQTVESMNSISDFKEKTDCIGRASQQFKKKSHKIKRSFMIVLIISLSIICCLQYIVIYVSLQLRQQNKEIREISQQAEYL